MNFIQRRKILKNTNSLDLTPIKKIEFKVESDNKITLLLPRFRNDRFRELFIPKSRSKYIQIKLDELGSATWLLIDGKKNVQQICRELEVQFGDKVSPVVERINKFLTGLYNNRYISFKQLED